MSHLPVEWAFQFYTSNGAAVRPDKPHTFRRKKKKPSEERISNFIARIAAHEETNGLEPIDKASLRVLANYQAVTKVKA